MHCYLGFCKTFYLKLFYTENGRQTPTITKMWFLNPFLRSNLLFSHEEYCGYFAFSWLKIKINYDDLKLALLARHLCWIVKLVKVNLMPAWRVDVASCSKMSSRDWSSTCYVGMHNKMGKACRWCKARSGKEKMKFATDVGVLTWSS